MTTGVMSSSTSHRRLGKDRETEVPTMSPTTFSPSRTFVITTATPTTMEPTPFSLQPGTTTSTPDPTTVAPTPPTPLQATLEPTNTVQEEEEEEDDSLMEVSLAPFQVDLMNDSIPNNNLDMELLLKSTSTYLLTEFQDNLPNSRNVQLTTSDERQRRNIFEYRRKLQQQQDDDDVQIINVKGQVLFANMAAPVDFVHAVQRLALQDVEALQQQYNVDFRDSTPPKLRDITILQVDGEEEGGDASTQESNNNNNGTNVGLIVGITIAGILVVGLVGFVVYWKMFRHNNHNKDGSFPSSSKDGATPTTQPDTENGGKSKSSTPAFDPDDFSLSSDYASPTTTSTRKSSSTTPQPIMLPNKPSAESDDDSTFSYGHVADESSAAANISLQSEEDLFAILPQQQQQSHQQRNTTNYLSQSMRPSSRSMLLSESNHDSNQLLSASTHSTFGRNRGHGGDLPFDEGLEVELNDQAAPPQTQESLSAAAAETDTKPSSSNVVVSPKISFKEEDDISNFLRERRRMMRQKRASRTQPPAEMEV